MRRAIRWAGFVFLAAIMTTVLPPAWGETPAAPDAAAQKVIAGYLENVTFERLPGKERVTMAVSKQSGVTVENQPGNSVLVRMENLFVPEGLRRPLSDPAFANVVRVTPVQKTAEGRSWVVATIDLKQKVPYSVRQEGMNILIDFNVASLAAAEPAPEKPLPVVQTPAARTAEKPATPGEKNAGEIAGNTGKETKTYGGPRISLDVQDADINKVVFRLLAELGKVSIVAGDDVKGTLTLKMEAVPWEQALDAILRITGLQKLEKDNVIMVMSRDNFLKVKADEEALARRKQMELDTEPLITRVVPIKYRLLKFVATSKIEIKSDTRVSRRESATGTGNLKGSISAGGSASLGGGVQQSKDFAGAASGQTTKAEKISLEGFGDFFAVLQRLLSIDAEDNPRGWIGADADTNSVIITAIKSDMDKIIDMIAKIDIQTDQVLIKANIVETTKSMARDLGITWGGLYNPTVGDHGGWITPNIGFPAVPLKGTAALLNLSFGTLGGNILDLQLSALQKDGKLNILSSPSIMTLDNQPAHTENGEKIPIRTLDKDGNPTTTYFPATLLLEITPHVIDSENMKMDIKVKKDEVDMTRTVLNNPFIINKETKTNLIVKDGETIVISGLTKQKKEEGTTGLPWFKDIPILGWLFKGEQKGESMEEVLIFITPTIIKPKAVAGIQTGP